MIRSLQDHFTRFRNPSFDLLEKPLAWPASACGFC
jgi:hypothetical protein